MVAQTEKIQALENQLTTIQFDQQANRASSIAPLVPGQVPASINTGDSTFTKETMEAMFKTWTATQAAGPVPTRALCLNGKDKKWKKTWRQLH